MDTLPAHLLSLVANKQAARTSDIAAEFGGQPRIKLLRALRSLAKKGFIFQVDDYEGRSRKNGRYIDALWQFNGETNGFTPEQAQSAIDAHVKGTCGMNLMMTLGLSC